MICYKFRMYPSRDQQSKFWKHANRLNGLYNYFLNQRIEARKNGKPVGRKQQQAELVALKKLDPELREIHSQVLQQVPMRLENSFRTFFRKDHEDQGFPRFRSCRKFFGICYPQSGYSIQGKVFHTKAYGDIGFHRHRDIQGNVRQVYVTEENGKWYLCATTDHESKRKAKEKEVGIDLGIANLVATSDGELFRNPGHANYFDGQIAKLQERRDTQCKKHSREWKRLTKVIGRLHGAKSRKTNDFLHKVSRNLSDRYDTIFHEDLDLKGMSESERTGINRGLRNSQLAKFVSYLSYKANRVVKVNPRNTSKTCSRCGNVAKMPLWKRTYRCQCGHVEDRDVNSAKNILCLGQAIVERQCTELTIQEALAFRRG